MSTGLPELIDPARLAERQARLEGDVPIARLARLHDLLTDTRGLVNVALSFDLDEQGRRHAVGRVSAALHLRCQRCLEAVDLSVSVETNLGIVASETEATDLPPEREPWVVESAPVSLFELLEEEIMLALPLSIAHTEGPCAERALQARGRPEDDRRQPFSGLSALIETRERK